MLFTYMNVVVFVALLGVPGALGSPASYADNQSAEIVMRMKQERFFSAKKFAVVGASDDDNKFGTVVFKALMDREFDVVPVNPFVVASQGVPCVHSLHNLTQAANTSISIVTQPSVSLQILKEAQHLNVHAIWLQPGAEDQEVVQYIRETPGMEKRTIYSEGRSNGVEMRDSEISPDCRLGNIVSALEVA